MNVQLKSDGVTTRIFFDGKEMHDIRRIEVVADGEMEGRTEVRVWFSNVNFQVDCACVPSLPKPFCDYYAPKLTADIPVLEV